MSLRSCARLSDPRRHRLLKVRRRARFASPPAGIKYQGTEVGEKNSRNKKNTIVPISARSIRRSSGGTEDENPWFYLFAGYSYASIDHKIVFFSVTIIVIV